MCTSLLLASSPAITATVYSVPRKRSSISMGLQPTSSRYCSKVGIKKLGFATIYKPTDEPSSWFNHEPSHRGKTKLPKIWRRDFGFIAIPHGTLILAAAKVFLHSSLFMHNALLLASLPGIQNQRHLIRPAECHLRRRCHE